MKTQPSALVRWLALALISFAMAGNYYIYDSISPLADLLVKQLNFTDANIGLLQGIYSVPNIIMVLLGGLLIDKIGTRKSVFIFTAIIMLGSIITALSGTLFGMASGRLIFGLGAESMIVAITTIIARWFKGKELSFAFGLNLTVARLGSFMALNSPSWGKSLYQYWQSPLLITMWAGVFALGCIVLYIFLDSYCSKKYEMPAEGQQDKIEFSQIFKFSSSFWYITALCVVFYSAMFPFQTFAIKFFQDVHGTSREAGGNLSSLLTLAAMIFTPLFGLMSDKVGKRSLLMMLGSVLIIPVYLLMAYSHTLNLPSILPGMVNIDIGFIDVHTQLPVYLLVPMAIMGISFSLIPAVMWPSVALIVKPSQLGTAYGLMTMIQNIGLAGFNFLIGYSNSLSGASALNKAGYNVGMWIFTSLGFFGLFFAFMLKLSNKKNKFGLELPAGIVTNEENN
jgi:MFS family permease